MKKKILYITQVFPYPADSGGKIKSLNTLLTLAKKYEVQLVCVSEKNPTTRELNVLKKLGITSHVFYNSEVSESIEEHQLKLLRFYLRGISHYFFQYYYEPAFSFIDELTQNWKPDVIHIDHVNLAQYLPKEKKEIWILESHNVEYQLLFTRFWYTRKKRWKRKGYLLLESLLTFWKEKKLTRKFDHIFSISQLDEKRLRKSFGVKNITVQNLVYPIVIPFQKRRFATKPYILFIGGLGWPPNEDAVMWFVLHVLPLVQKKIKQAQLHVVGHDIAHLYVKVREQKGTFFHGFQKDITPFLKKAQIFVLPFRMGGGVRIKAFTATAHGVPMISTHLGTEGIGFHDGEEILYADTAQDFADKMIELITNRELQKKLVKKAQAYIEKFHSVKQNTIFLKEYQKVIDRLL
jgi:glycosyltransferase involved in cell wall biosynthesis